VTEFNVSRLLPATNVCYWRILLKKSKIEGSENLANIECWRSQPLQGSAVSMRASVVAFALVDVVPQIAARETHERP
jgi:hypothetical protein